MLFFTKRKRRKNHLVQQKPKQVNLKDESQKAGGSISLSDNQDCNYFQKDSLNNSSSLTLTWSLEICSSTSDGANSLPDYLKSVKLARESDSYSIDETHFYYYINDISSYLESDKHDVELEDEIKVELCFYESSTISNNNNEKTHSNVIVAAEYCLYDYDNKENAICSNHGIYVTDVCDTDSDNQQDIELPPATIDYLPRTHHTYKFGSRVFVSFVVVESV